MTRIKFALLCLPLVVICIILYRFFLRVDRIPIVPFGQAHGMICGIIAIIVGARWEFCNKKYTTAIPVGWAICQTLLTAAMLRQPIYALVAIGSVIFMFLYTFFLEDKH